MLTFVAAATIVAVIAAWVLTKAPPRVLLVSAPGLKAVGPAGAHVIGAIGGDLAACQSGESLPAGVTAIRASLWAFYGAEVHVLAYRGSKLIAQGARGADWTTDSVTMPVKPQRHSTSHVTVCLAIGPNSEPMTLIGAPASAHDAASIQPPGTPLAQLARGASVSLASDVRPVTRSGRRLQGRLVFEYLASGSGSWWSRALAVARHMGLGRAFGGSWIALLVAALMLAVGALAVRLTLREMR